MKVEFEQDELNLIEIAQKYADEDTARNLFESMLWPNGAICPHCKCDDVYKVTPNQTPAPTANGSKPRKVRHGLYSCAACRKQFTVTVGTVMEASHIPITKWVMAMAILCASKKSISAHQLHRMLNITYKSAWFLAHRSGNNSEIRATKKSILYGVSFCSNDLLIRRPAAMTQQDELRF